METEGRRKSYPEDRTSHLCAGLSIGSSARLCVPVRLAKGGRYD
jgi:hypothetical protein